LKVEEEDLCGGHTSSSFSDVVGRGATTIVPTSSQEKNNNSRCYHQLSLLFFFEQSKIPILRKSFREKKFLTSVAL